MRDASRPVSFGLFVLVLFCFMLPFARISCNNEEVSRATGYEVAFGTEIEARPNPSRDVESIPTGLDVVAIACLATAGVGIGLTLVRGRRGAVARAILSGHGMLFLLLLRVALRNRAQENGVVLQMLAGYWAALALFFAVGVANLFSLRRQPGADSEQPRSAAGIAAPPPPRRA
jgi:hypothetical protein